MEVVKIGESGHKILRNIWNFATFARLPLSNFQLKTLKLDWVAFHSVTFQLKCLDLQSIQYEKLVPVLSHLCNGLQTSAVFSEYS